MAIKGANTLLRVSTATTAAKTITGITAANPPVVTSTAHALTNGTIVVITGVVGMTQLNNRAFVVANQATNTFELKGVDGTSYSAYTSGGSATPQTMTAIGEVAEVSGFDGQSDEIETTHLQSTAKEFLVGMQDFGNVSMKLNLVTDTGQARLRSLKASGSVGTFAITLSDSTVSSFQALVKSLSFDSVTPNSAVTGSCSLRTASEPAWFA